MGERDLLMRFFFKSSNGAFDLEDLGAFFDSEFPAAVGCALHFTQRAFLSRPIAVFLGRRVFRGPLFHFVEKQLPFDLVMCLPEVSRPFSRGLAASTTSDCEDRQGKGPRQESP
jgi:hypothetical protein